MAMANYEGQAYRDGEHWHEGCDVTLPAAEGKYPHTPHAVAGDGSIRVGVQKTTPMLYRQLADGTWTCEALRGLQRISPAGMVGTVDAIGISPPGGGPGVAILSEPGGTIWTAVGAYEPFDSWCEEDRP